MKECQCSSSKRNIWSLWNCKKCTVVIDRDVRDRLCAYCRDCAQVDLQVDPKLNISKGFAYVEYENADDASRGQQFMDGGQLDGNKIRVTYVLVSKRGRQNSPGL